MTGCHDQTRVWCHSHEQCLEQARNCLRLWTKEITLDEISLPTRDINKLKTWKSRNLGLWITASIKTCPKKSQSTLEATKCLIQTVDAKYEKADLGAIMENDGKHLSATEQGHGMLPINKPSTLQKQPLLAMLPLPHWLLSGLWDFHR